MPPNTRTKRTSKSATVSSSGLLYTTYEFIQRLRARGRTLRLDVRDLLLQWVQLRTIASDNGDTTNATLWDPECPDLQRHLSQAPPLDDAKAVVPLLRLCTRLAPLQLYELQYLNLAIVLHSLTIMEIKNLYRFLLLRVDGSPYKWCVRRATVASVDVHPTPVRRVARQCPFGCVGRCDRWHGIKSVRFGACVARAVLCQSPLCVSDAVWVDVGGGDVVVVVWGVPQDMGCSQDDTHCHISARILALAPPLIPCCERLSNTSNCLSINAMSIVSGQCLCGGGALGVTFRTIIRTI